MSLDFAKLRHRVVIQSFTTTRGSYGDEIKTWADQGTRWASIEPLSGKEFTDAQQVKAESTHRITLRHYQGLTSTQRITHFSRTFQIMSVLNPNELDELSIVLCKEMV